MSMKDHGVELRIIAPKGMSQAEAGKIAQDDFAEQVIASYEANGLEVRKKVVGHELRCEELSSLLIPHPNLQGFRFEVRHLHAAAVRNLRGTEGFHDDTVDAISQAILNSLATAGYAIVKMEKK